MVSAYLLTGSNQGNRVSMLEQARNSIETECGEIRQVSSIYETAAWGKEDQDAFLNQAIHVKTALKPEELLETVLGIEKTMGRIREEKYGPRVIDIDIIFYGNKIRRSPTLTVPHPEVQNRRFALTPLAEIAAEYVHPVFKKTVKQLLDECGDRLEVRGYKL